MNENFGQEIDFKKIAEDVENYKDENEQLNIKLETMAHFIQNGSEESNISKQSNEQTKTIVEEKSIKPTFGQDAIDFEKIKEQIRKADLIRQKQLEEELKEIDFWKEYIKRIHLIECSSLLDMKKTPVIKEYLATYNDINTAYDMTGDFLIYSDESEKLVMEELKKQGFNKDEIVSAVYKCSPLQLSREDCEKLFENNNINLENIPSIKEFVKKHKTPQKFLEEFLEKHNLNIEDISLNSIYENNKSNRAIADEICKSIKAHKRMNKIRNHFVFMGKIYNFASNVSRIFKGDLKNISPVNLFNEYAQTPKYEYLKQATAFCHNDKVMSWQEELYLFKENKCDFQIAKNMFLEGYDKAVIEKTLFENSPLMYDRNEAKAIVKNIEIMSKQERLFMLGQRLSQKSGINNLSEEYVMLAYKKLQSNSSKVWTREDDMQIASQLKEKGYNEERLKDIIRLMSPLATTLIKENRVETVEPKKVNSSNATENNDKNASVSLKNHIEQLYGNVSDRKIMSDVLKDSEKFHELKNKTGILQRKIVFDTIKEIRKHNRFYTR